VSDQAPKFTPPPWTQGRTLLTEQTKFWSRQQWKKNEAVEKCRVFANFSDQDQGRGRELIATFGTEEDAQLASASPDMYAALQPFAKIAEEAKKLRHGPGSTSEWRLKYDDLMAVVAALAKAVKP